MSPTTSTSPKRAPKPPYNPNPTYGHLTLIEKLTIIPIFLYALLLAPPTLLLRRLFTPHTATTPTFDFFLSLLRLTSPLLTTRQVRYISGSDSSASSTILTSPRYSPYASNLYHPISTSTLRAFLPICGTFTTTIPPKEADIVIYYLHGGGYTLLEPGNLLHPLLMLAESITRTGKTLAIFALDYRLAPESPWPAQLEDAAEGYSYLTREMGVPEEKVVLLGDSAGGHLVLALLTHLRYPHPRINPNPTQELEKPGAAVLLSPWASFRTDAESYRRNYYKDVVSGRRMAIMAAELRGPRKVISDPDEEGIWGFYTEFRHPVKGREIRLWRDVLPKRIYVSAGEDEVLVGDIVGFVESIREEMGARGVRFELYEGEIHDRWVKKVLISDSALGRHLKAGLGEEMEVGVESEELAGVILGLVKNDE